VRITTAAPAGPVADTMTIGLSLLTVVGNPKPGSRTLAAASTLADALATRWESTRNGNDPDALSRQIVDLAEIGDGLLAPWRLSDAGAQAAAAVRGADLLVIATPTYKASFTGLLKLFLDVLPAGSLAATIVVPLTMSGGPAHRHLADLQLRPVLSELGAVVPAPTLLLEEAELGELPAIVDDYLRRHGPVITAALRAVVTPRREP
jgi:FMN reductase